MLGLIVQLLVSWLIIWVTERKHLTVLGLTPTRVRIFRFFIFFFLTAFLCSMGFLLKMFFGNQHWTLNPLLSMSLIWKGTYWTIVSVLFEELIFRGVLLYISIKRLGNGKAILISAVAFGIYHWFSFGILGNIPQMAMVFFITGAMGLLLAYGYAKTLSMYVPIAIHFGWNITEMFVFSQGPIGNGIFIPVIPGPFRTNSYLLYFAATFVPIFGALIVNYVLLKKLKLVSEVSTIQ